MPLDPRLYQSRGGLLSSNPMERRFALYYRQPWLYTEDQVDEMEEHAKVNNIEFQRQIDPSGANLLGVVNQLTSGIVEGFTTLGWADEPGSTAESIAQRVGHLIGLVPDVIAGVITGGTSLSITSAKLAAKVGAKGAVKRFAKKEAADVVRGAIAPIGKAVAGEYGVQKAATKLASAAFGRDFIGGPLALRSIPMRMADWATGAGGRMMADAGWDAAKYLKQGSWSRSILRQSIHLGTALGVSAWQEGPKGIAQGAMHGAIAGAAFGGIGNFMRIDKMLKSGVPGLEAEARATIETIAKGMAGSAFTGVPSTMAGEEPAAQIYEYLLGFFFGASSQPAYKEAANKVVSEASKTVETAFKPWTLDSYARLTDEAKKFVRDQSESRYGRFYTDAGISEASLELLKRLTGHDNPTLADLKEYMPIVYRDAVAKIADERYQEARGEGKPIVEEAPDPAVVGDTIMAGLKKQVSALRQDDGTILKKDRAEFTRLDKLQAERTQLLDTDTTGYLIPFQEGGRERPSQFDSAKHQDNISLIEMMVESSIQDAIAGKRTVEQVLQSMHGLLDQAGLVMSAFDVSVISRYISNRIEGGETIGNNKEPFGVWRRGETTKEPVDQVPKSVVPARVELDLLKRDLTPERREIAENNGGFLSVSFSTGKKIEELTRQELDKLDTHLDERLSREIEALSAKDYPESSKQALIEQKGRVYEYDKLVIKAERERRADDLRSLKGQQTLDFKDSQEKQNYDIGRYHADNTPIATQEFIAASLKDIMGPHAPRLKDVLVSEIDRNPDIVGRYMNGMIQFIEGRATERTAIHEPVHWFFNKVMTQKEYDFLFGQFRQDTKIGTEEAMVDAAVDFLEGKRTFTGRIAAILRHFWRSIKKMLNRELTPGQTVEDYFSRIGKDYEIRSHDNLMKHMKVNDYDSEGILSDIDVSGMPRHTEWTADEVMTRMEMESPLPEQLNTIHDIAKILYKKKQSEYKARESTISQMPPLQMPMLKGEQGTGYLGPKAVSEATKNQRLYLPFRQYKFEEKLLGLKTDKISLTDPFPTAGIPKHERFAVGSFYDYIKKTYPRKKSIKVSELIQSYKEFIEKEFPFTAYIAVHSMDDPNQHGVKIPYGFGNYFGGAKHITEQGKLAFGRILMSDDMFYTSLGHQLKLIGEKLIGDPKAKVSEKLMKRIEASDPLFLEGVNGYGWYNYVEAKHIADDLSISYEYQSDIFDKLKKPDRDKEVKERKLDVPAGLTLEETARYRVDEMVKTKVADSIETTAKIRGESLLIDILFRGGIRGSGEIVSKRPLDEIQDYINYDVGRGRIKRLGPPGTVQPVRRETDLITSHREHNSREIKQLKQNIYNRELFSNQKTLSL